MIYMQILKYRVFFMLVLLSFVKTTGATDAFEWQRSIDSSCGATILGKSKGVFREGGFWFSTLVSMDMWADSMRIDPPQSTCQSHFAIDKDVVRYGRCMAYIQDKLDWYKRCRPLVDYIVRQESKK